MTLDFTVEGITCAGCATDIETVLGNMDGVLKADVDYAENIVHVEYDPVEVQEEKIILALRGLGLEVRQKNTGG
ncbi:MAG: heavy metal-associated domain-containing protein [Thermodesulfovibrionales bacterium]|nr:heavy metal-associated domain-containing protein [Thermodesulfovibrionales bacterium]